MITQSSLRHRIPRIKIQGTTRRASNRGIDSRASLYNVTFNLQDCLQSYRCHLIITSCLLQTPMPLRSRAMLDDTVRDPAIHSPKHCPRKIDSNPNNRKVEPCRATREPIRSAHPRPRNRRCPRIYPRVRRDAQECPHRLQNIRHPVARPRQCHGHMPRSDRQRRCGRLVGTADGRAGRARERGKSVRHEPLLHRLHEQPGQPVLKCEPCDGKGWHTRRRAIRA